MKNKKYYNEGIQDYTNSERSDSDIRNTTFQRRGYLECKCEPDVFISESSKCVAEQLDILKEMRAKEQIEENGMFVRERGTIAHRAHAIKDYHTPEENKIKPSPLTRTYGNFHLSTNKTGILQ